MSACGERCTCGSLFGLVHKPECPEAAEIDKRYGEPTPTGTGEVELAPVDVDMACRIAADVAADGRLRLDRQRLAGLLRDAADALHSAREEAGRLGRERDEAREAAERQKQIRIRWQTRVYDACRALDIALGRSVINGTCTTEDKVVAAIEALRDQRAGLSKQCAARDAELAGVREAVEEIGRVVTDEGIATYDRLWRIRDIAAQLAARSGAGKEG